jgi:hypothetical protein
MGLTKFSSKKNNINTFLLKITPLYDSSIFSKRFSDKIFFVLDYFSIFNNNISFSLIILERGS